MNTDTSSKRQLRDDPVNPNLINYLPAYNEVQGTDGTYKDFACDREVDSEHQNERTKVWKLNAMSEPNKVYIIDSNFDLGNRIVEIPENCTIVFMDGGQFVNGTLISHDTRFVDFPRYDSQGHPGASTRADIIGRIFNVHGQEISVRGDVIHRSTPVVYTHCVRTTTGYDEDSYHLCQADNRARNVGLTECILQFGVFGSNLINAYMTGGWIKISSNVNNTPARIAQEAFVNGLSVKALKFHSNYWRGSVEDYCSFVLDFTCLLMEQFQALNMPQFTEVYIVNERGDWTDKYSHHVSELSALANSISNLGKIPRISFAGIRQLAQADPQFHGLIKPSVNTYPSLTFLDDDLEDIINGYANYSDELNAKVRRRIEQQFEAIMIDGLSKDAKYWCSAENVACNLALSEIGVKPYSKALRAPERYDPDLIGHFYRRVMPVYWQTVKEFASRMQFEYINLYYSSEIQDQDSTTWMTDELYNILINF